ncbi:MAG: DUF4242 domain-containing protein [Anaerolineales bacterium]|nr:DUF4242 domain-containing protein [Anaerolineales bacterium]
MPKYIIERIIPDAGKLSSADLQAIADKSCSVLHDLGPSVQWLQSFVTADRLYCTYISPDKQMILEHARRGGFPADRISEIQEIIDPTTAEA